MLTTKTIQNHVNKISHSQVTMKKVKSQIVKANSFAKGKYLLAVRFNIWVQETSLLDNLLPLGQVKSTPKIQLDNSPPIHF